MVNLRTKHAITRIATYGGSVSALIGLGGLEFERGNPIADTILLVAGAAVVIKAISYDRTLPRLLRQATLDDTSST